MDRVHFIPAELVEIVLRNAGEGATLQELAVYRRVDKAWLEGVDKLTVRLKPRDLARRPNLSSLISYVKKRFKNVRVLDFSRSWPHQLLLMPAQQLQPQIQKYEAMFAALSKWPGSVILRAGVRSLQHHEMRNLLAHSPVTPRITGIYYFKDYKGAMPEHPLAGIPALGVLQFMSDALQACINVGLHPLAPHLQELSFTELQIPSLDQTPVLLACTQLTKLVFEEGIMREIPRDLRQMTALRSLTLANCHLRVHGQDKFGRLPPQLQHLTLTHSQVALNIHPKDFQKHRQLVSLDLSHNQIGALPATIGELRELQHLDVSNNSLVSLPNSMARLHRLKTLRVDHNKIKQLPREIHHIFWLEVLDASHNEIKALPHEMHHLHYLRYLDLRGNPLKLPLHPPHREMLMGRRSIQTCLYNESVAPPRDALKHREPHPALHLPDQAAQQEQQQQEAWEEGLAMLAGLAGQVE